MHRVYLVTILAGEGEGQPVAAWSSKRAAQEDADRRGLLYPRKYYVETHVVLDGAEDERCGDESHGVDRPCVLPASHVEHQYVRVTD